MLDESSHTNSILSEYLTFKARTDVYVNYLTNNL